MRLFVVDHLGLGGTFKHSRKSKRSYKNSSCYMYAPMSAGPKPRKAKTSSYAKANGTNSQLLRLFHNVLFMFRLFRSIAQ